ncbi:hypothetical protein GOP47_0004008 [Adiantum capillus-veneris]|uniref:Acid phosphatase/vanadium-dependent haloperoxidase-related protein n=1 Tax=Adiantum capillus-veneris TaxID=13818 RepID=A0A9D4V7D5_ADICA|nr:hypothetical protein GOP47_0004008 [Adiantum capillus-veneris]
MLRGGSSRSALDSLHLPSPSSKTISSSSLHSSSLQPLILRRSQGHGLCARSRCQPTLALLADTNIQDLSNNQVLVSVLTASLIGQALKPITAAVQGKGFNWKLLFASGGMPSSHSACVTAACTSIALERGLADSLFGLSLIFAGIVMYDAQGVRRAVGKQAEVINTIVVRTDSKPSTVYQQSLAINQQADLQPAEASMKSGSYSNQRRSSTMAPMSDEQLLSENSTINDILTKGSSYQRSQKFAETAKKLPSVEAGDVNVQEIGDLDGWRHIPLKESVGHTKLEVFVGALWGIICTLALSNFLLEFP